MNNSTTVATTVATATASPNPFEGRENYLVANITIRAIFTIIGLFGNGVVFFVITTKKKKKNNNDIYLLNLAFADFLYIIFADARYLHSYLDHSPRSLFFCKVVFPGFSVPFVAGIFIITAMAIQRCRVILNPWKPKQGVCCTYSSVAFVWFLSILVLLPVTIFAQNIGIACPMIGKGWSPHASYIYFLLVSAIQYPIPLVIITFAYVRIAIYLSKPRVPRRSVIAKGGTLYSPSDETRRESIQITKTVGVIVLLFAVLMLPQQIAMLAAMVFKVRKSWVALLWDFSDVLGTINSSLDPYVYSARTKEYREIISKWFAWLCPLYKRRLARSRGSRNDRSVFPTGNDKCFTNEEALRTVEDVSIDFPDCKSSIRKLSFPKSKCPRKTELAC